MRFYLSAMETIPTANFQPDIAWNGIRVGEPVITLTGLLVAAFCFYAWWRLGKINTGNDSYRLSRIFFLLTGLSTVIGACVGHALLYALPFEYKMPGWLLGMIAVSALEQASIVRAEIGRIRKKALSYLNIAELTLAIWFVSSSLWFPGVEIHSAFGVLLIIAPLEIIQWRQYQSAGSRHMLFGILFLVAAVLPHILKFSFGKWFCYFDIAHLIMCGAIWQFMLATEKYAAPQKSA